MATPRQGKNENKADFIRRFAAIRTKRLEKRVGKPMIFSEEAMLLLLMERKVPTMVQHCVLKVRQKVSGNEADRFIGAFNICAWCFQHYGYLKKSRSQMSMTGKGMKRNRRHQREKEAGSKSNAYNALVKKLWGESVKVLKAEKSRPKKKDA